MRSGKYTRLAGALSIVRDEWRPVDCYEELTEATKILVAELAFEVRLDVRHAVSHDATDRTAPIGELDPTGALVVRVVAAFEIAQLFEFPEEVVHRLSAHAGLGGDVGGTTSLGSGVAEHGRVGGDEIGESGRVQVVLHPLTDRIERHPKQRSDEWRVLDWSSCHNKSTLQLRPTPVQ